MSSIEIATKKSKNKSKNKNVVEINADVTESESENSYSSDYSTSADYEFDHETFNFTCLGEFNGKNVILNQREFEELRRVCHFLNQSPQIQHVHKKLGITINTKFIKIKIFSDVLDFSMYKHYKDICLMVSNWKLIFSVEQNKRKPNSKKGNKNKKQKLV